MTYPFRTGDYEQLQTDMPSKFKVGEILVRKTIPLIPMLVIDRRIYNNQIYYSLSRWPSKKIVIIVQEKRLKKILPHELLEYRICQ